MKDILKMLSGGDFQSGVYAKGGSLEAHGIQEGDTFIKTIRDFQKVKDKNGKIVYVDLSSGERDSQPPLPFKNGGALVGNQKRIDMNKNGKIDAEDFKLLRSSMNGAWRNEHKHVNKDEDYEVRYARKKPSRTGYKGKRNFEGGGGVNVGYNVFNYTDNIYATDEVFKNKVLANKFIKEFRNRFANQGYYRDNRMNKINIQDIDLLAIPSDFNPFRKMAKGGGVGAYYIVTFGFNGDEGYQVVNSKPIFAKSENEAELMLKDQFESYEGVSCEIISTKKQLATGGRVSKSMQSKKMFFGGGLKKISTLKKYENFEGKIVITKDEKVFKVISQDKDMVEVINPNLLGTGVRPTSINISEINKIV